MQTKQQAELFFGANENHKYKGLEGWKSALAASHQLRTISEQTNDALYANGYQIDRIYDKTNDIETTLNGAYITSKEMCSFWYRMKRKVAKTLGFERKAQPAKEIPRAGVYVKYDFPHATETINIYSLPSYRTKEDEIIDEILDNVYSAKQQAKDLGNELDRQAIVLDTMGKNMDNSNRKMYGINKRLYKKFF